jgi:hypothetical protein
MISNSKKAREFISEKENTGEQKKIELSSLNRIE